MPKDTTIIRPYEDGDLESLRTMMNEVVLRGDAFTYDTPFALDEMRTYVGSYATAFVAVEGDRVMGGYVLRPTQPGRGSHVANATYMVASTARGRGLGRLPGEHSIKMAKEMGFTAMQFNAVVASNTEAVALWQRLGFKIIGTVPQAFRHADGRLVDLQIMHRFV